MNKKRVIVNIRRLKNKDQFFDLADSILLVRNHVRSIFCVERSMSC